MNAKEFYEYLLNDKTSVVGRQDKDEIIMLMEEYHNYRVKNLTIPDVSNRREQLIAFACKLNNVSVEQYGKYYATKVDNFLKNN